MAVSRGTERGDKRSYRNARSCPSALLLLRPATSWQRLRMSDWGKGAGPGIESNNRENAHRRTNADPSAAAAAAAAVAVSVGTRRSDKGDEDEDVGEDNVGSRWRWWLCGGGTNDGWWW